MLFFKKHKYYWLVLPLGIATGLALAAEQGGKESGGAQRIAEAVKSALPYDATVYGDFKRMKMADYGPRVRLGDLPMDKGLYGVGALSGLRGEITLVDGKAYVSLGSADGSRLLLAGVDKEEACLLVTAKNTEWKTIPLPKDMS